MYNVGIVKSNLVRLRQLFPLFAFRMLDRICENPPHSLPMYHCWLRPSLKNYEEIFTRISTRFITVSPLSRSYSNHCNIFSRVICKGSHNCPVNSRDEIERICSLCFSDCKFKLEIKLTIKYTFNFTIMHYVKTLRSRVDC